MKSFFYFAATMMVASNANAATTYEMDYQPRMAVALEPTTRFAVSSHRSIIIRVWPRQATLEDCEAALDMMVENELPPLRAMGRIVHSKSFCAPMEENDAEGGGINPGSVTR